MEHDQGIATRAMAHLLGMRGAWQLTRLCMAQVLANKTVNKSVSHKLNAELGHLTDSLHVSQPLHPNPKLSILTLVPQHQTDVT